MEHKLAQRICTYLSKSKAITEDLKDVYVYGFELLLSFVMSVLTILLVGLLTNKIIISLTYLFIFIFTRRYVGGYHASTHFRCQLCSLTVFSIVLVLTCFLNVQRFMIHALAIIGLISIITWAPIENPHKPISKKQQKTNKVYGLVIFLATSIISLLIRNYNITLCNAAFYTQTAVIALMIQPIIMKRREQHESKV